ncbi:TrbG/VirB9 family P-type conjugative transfer protein [Vitreimonas flagellata]|uniref:TrbG/VirB9 family P-type conjugative transfer protein n=1 Tax=Vitreimonas flagellata TaxID=2560861 RepID=UPI001074F5ED|nr:TrbG/VirB9 family P-type conjugative transfer protein [Vitreimonas flagellata]
MRRCALTTSAIAFVLAFVFAPGTRAQTNRATSPLNSLAEANAEARRRPDPANFIDATQIYDFADGALYEIYAAPGFISAVLLEPGETITSIAAGDTTRWMVEEASSGHEGETRPLILVKPLRGGVRTNILVVTDRRVYSLEAIAVAGQTYSARTAWRYAAADPASLAEGYADPTAINTGYRIRVARGPSPRWLPRSVYDDGQRTYIEFPPELATTEAPPLFVLDGGEPALVNYRTISNRYVIDRLFDAAELRLGGERPTIVRITRNGASTHPPTTPRRRR